MSVRVYVEGGGNQNKALQTRCRKGFSEFLDKSGLAGRMPRIIACGGRQHAFENFETAHEQQDATSRPVLLVDSEGPVHDSNPWDHVRREDGWQRPVGASQDQLHLMVQTMEAWFHADPAALASFYGQCFRSSALSPQSSPESVSKAQLFSGLSAATKTCSKGEYSKGDHSFQILERLDPAKVRAASPWCDRLLRTLKAL